MEMQVEPVDLRGPRASRGLDRVLADRQLWKNAIYSIAFLTYLCSFLFFGLGIADARESGGSTQTVIDMLVALYFLVQVIFLFVLSGAVERRRQNQRIDFPDRRLKS